MKRNRPCQHYRTIKTKKGKKRILVNKGRKKKNYGYFPTKKKIPLEERPIHSLTDEEYAKVTKKMNYGFEPWDAGDTSFKKKLKKEIRILQQKRDSEHTPNYLKKFYDNELQRKVNVVSSMDDRKETINKEKTNKYEPVFFGLQPPPETSETLFKDKKHQEELQRDELAEQQTQKWREIQQIKAGRVHQPYISPDELDKQIKEIQKPKKEKKSKAESTFKITKTPNAWNRIMNKIEKSADDLYHDAPNANKLRKQLNTSISKARSLSKEDKDRLKGWVSVPPYKLTEAEQKEKDEKEKAKKANFL